MRHAFFGVHELIGVIVVEDHDTFGAEQLHPGGVTEGVDSPTARQYVDITLAELDQMIRRQHTKDRLRIMLREHRGGVIATLLPLRNDEHAGADPSGERGLHFICLGANLSRQFEFVQHTWANNPKFNGLYDDPDPLIGDRDPRGKGKQGTFTEQARPVRRRTTGMPSFVGIRGGAYFFLPGVRALRYLAAL